MTKYINVRKILVALLIVSIFALVACAGDAPEPDNEIDELEFETTQVTTTIGETIIIGDWEVEVANIVRNGWHEDDDGLIVASYSFYSLIHGQHQRHDGRDGWFDGVYCGRAFCSNFRNL